MFISPLSVLAMIKCVLRLKFNLEGIESATKPIVLLSSNDMVRCWPVSLFGAPFYLPVVNVVLLPEELMINRRQAKLKKT